MRVTRACRCRTWTVLPVILLLSFAAKPQGGAPRGGQWSIKPFHILGALYYVGLSDNTSFLFHTSQGDILLDPLNEPSAGEVRQNIEQLGFNMKDIKIILQSHAHSDHVGAMATFKEWTGAKVLVMGEDAPLMEDGGKGDYRNVKGTESFKPLHPDGLLHDGEKVTLGDVTMVAHLTPAHTKGCTTWSTVLEENGKKYNTVFICSMRMNTGIPLLNNARYPNLPQDWAKGFKTLRGLKADMFFVSHGGQFDMTERLERWKQDPKTNPFMDPAGFKAYVDTYQKAFEDQLAKEKAGGPAYAVSPTPLPPCPQDGRKCYGN
jgi:metallo-beta-lactamase class B